MSPIAHKKLKERIALAVRIEAADRPARSCSRCQGHSRACFLDLSLSSRCSECVRSKKACDASGYAVPLKQVCRFFRGPRGPPLRVPSDPPIPWFPAFELDAFLESFVWDVPEDSGFLGVAEGCTEGTVSSSDTRPVDPGS